MKLNWSSRFETHRVSATDLSPLMIFVESEHNTLYSLIADLKCVPQLMLELIPVNSLTILDLFVVFFEDVMGAADIPLTPIHRQNERLNWMGIVVNGPPENSDLIFDFFEIRQNIIYIHAFPSSL